MTSLLKHRQSDRQSDNPYHAGALFEIMESVVYGSIDLELRSTLVKQKAKTGTLDLSWSGIERSLIGYRIAESVVPVLWGRAPGGVDFESLLIVILEEIRDQIGVWWSVYAGRTGIGLAACDLAAIRSELAKKYKSMTVAEIDDSEVVEKAGVAVIRAVFSDYLAMTVASDQEIQITQGTAEGYVQFTRTMSAETGGFYPTECAIEQMGVKIPTQPDLPNNATAGLALELKFGSKKKVVVMESTGQSSAKVTLSPGSPKAVLSHASMRTKSWTLKVEDAPKPAPKPSNEVPE